MPFYHELSESIVKSWIEPLESLSKEIMSNSTINNVSLLIIWVYEYIQVCTAYLNGSHAGKYPGGYTIIKKYVKPECYTILKQWLSHANNLRHCAYKQHKVVENFINMLSESTPEVSIICSSFLNDLPVTCRILKSKSRLKSIKLEILKKSGLYRRCRMFAKGMLSTAYTGESKYTVGEVVKKMVRAYNVSEQYAKNIVFELISNQVVLS